MIEGMWNCFSASPLVTTRDRADSKMTTRLTAPMLFAQVSPPMRAAIPSGLLTENLWVLLNYLYLLCEDDVPYTMFPIVSNLAPPTGHLLTSSRKAFLCSQKRRTLLPTSNRASIPVVSSESDNAEIAAYTTSVDTINECID
jgi:hypothetical protein